MNSPRTHFVKIEQDYYENLIDCRKSCEIRFNDRDYQVGDFLEFQTKDLNELGGKWIINHIHSGLGKKRSPPPKRKASVKEWKA